MRALMGLMGVVFAGCNCGFEPVDECPSLNCFDSGATILDAGRRDAGAPDAGAPDAGRPDAGVFDAGLYDAGLIDAGSSDAGPRDAGAPDAGPPSDGGCLGELRRLISRPGDYVHIEGTTAAYGQVDYVIGGYSAGVWGIDGIQRFTNASYLALRVPGGVFDTGLWMWTGNQSPVIEDFPYLGNNLDQNFGSTPFLDFRILPGVSCSPGAGSGVFEFDTFRPPSNGPRFTEGIFSFECPDAGISVRGCFHYQ